MATDQIQTEEVNTHRRSQQEALKLIAEELRRDMEAYQTNFERVKLLWDLSEEERLSLNRRMNALDRMISEVRG